METGTVKFFNETKGFGFIEPEAGGKDLFVHISGVVGEINQGDKVTFDVEDGRKGPMAVNVKIA
ncbi:MAG: cold-shock protein [Bacteroidota bacterium]